MQRKYERCVKAVKKQRGVNPYAVCHASLGRKIHNDKYNITHPEYINYCEMCGKKMKKTKVEVSKINACKECMNKHGGFNFDKSLDKESKHMTKMRRKYKNHKFTKDEVIGYD